MNRSETIYLETEESDTKGNYGRGHSPSAGLSKKCKQANPRNSCHKRNGGLRRVSTRQYGVRPEDEIGKNPKGDYTTTGKLNNHKRGVGRAHSSALLWDDPGESQTLIIEDGR